MDDIYEPEYSCDVIDTNIGNLKTSINDIDNSIVDLKNLITSLSSKDIGEDLSDTITHMSSILDNLNSASDALNVLEDEGFEYCRQQAVDIRYWGECWQNEAVNLKDDYDLLDQERIGHEEKIEDMINDLDDQSKKIDNYDEVVSTLKCGIYNIERELISEQNKTRWDHLKDVVSLNQM